MQRKPFLIAIARKNGEICNFLKIISFILLSGAFQRVGQLIQVVRKWRSCIFFQNIPGL